jgi:plasmid stabilization system protein ParE
MSEYALHPQASQDLDDIWDFIRADNLDAADRVVADVLDTVRRLARSPHIGHRREDLTTRPLRFHRVRDYLVAYAPDEQPLLGDCRAPWPQKPTSDGRPT